MTTASSNADLDAVFRPHRRIAPPPGVGLGSPPAAVAVDLGSGQARVWAAAHGIHAAPTAKALSQSAPLVLRGRIADGPGCVSLLTRLLPNLPARPVVVACRPVLAAPGEEDALRRVVTDAFKPAAVLLIDTVRAAAIGAGAATGVLLIADIGAQITEVTVLANGRVAAARRADLGTADPAAARRPGLLAGVTTRLVEDLRRDPRTRRLTTAALARGVIAVGDGATRTQLIAQVAANLQVRVRSAASPREAALRGATLAAASACRHPALAGWPRPPHTDRSSEQTHDRL